VITTLVWEPQADGRAGQEQVRELRDLAELETISDLLAAGDRLIWLDLERPSPEELRLVAEEFGFHELAIEDAAARHQRPKIEAYDTFSFLVLYAALPGPPEARPAGRAPAAAGAPPFLPSTFALHEISFFIGDRYLVTVHDAPVPYLAQSLERWRRNRRVIAEGIGVLLYSLLDGIVDGYFPILDQTVERVEEMEEALFVGVEQGRPYDMRTLFKIKKDLLALRRVVVPARDVLLVLARQDLPLFDGRVSHYFQDVYDHVVRIVDAIDLYQDLLTNALESYLSLVSNQLNQVMKTLTALTVILMVVALVAGIYGMNFQVMPELGWRLGYAWALGLMAVLSGALFVYFRRKGWL